MHLGPSVISGFINLLSLFCFSLLQNKIQLCIYLGFFYSFVYRWTSRLIPIPCCYKQCLKKHGCVSTSVIRHRALWLCIRSGIAGSRGHSVFSVWRIFPWFSQRRTMTVHSHNSRSSCKHENLCTMLLCFESMKTAIQTSQINLQHSLQQMQLLKKSCWTKSGFISLIITKWNGLCSNWGPFQKSRSWPQNNPSLESKLTR